MRLIQGIDTIVKTKFQPLKQVRPRRIVSPASFVIPAKAGIYLYVDQDSGLRGIDELIERIPAFAGMTDVGKLKCVVPWQQPIGFRRCPLARGLAPTFETHISGE